MLRAISDAYVALYTDYCRSLAHHGFKRILCISGHGGNFAR
jgi:creatinine amidohydrolase